MSIATVCLIVVSGVVAINGMYMSSADLPDYALIPGANGRSRLVNIKDRPDSKIAMVPGRNGRSRLVRIFDRPDIPDKILVQRGRGQNRHWVVADSDQLMAMQLLNRATSRQRQYHGRKKRAILLPHARFMHPMLRHHTAMMALNARRARFLGGMFGFPFIGMRPPFYSRPITTRRRPTQAQAAAAPGQQHQPLAPAQSKSPAAAQQAPAQVAHITQSAQLQKNPVTVDMNMAPSAIPSSPAVNNVLSEVPVDAYNGLQDQMVNIYPDASGGMYAEPGVPGGMYQDVLANGVDLAGYKNIQNLVESGNTMQSIAGNGNMQVITGAGGLNQFDVVGLKNTQDITGSRNIGQEILGDGNMQVITGSSGVDPYGSLYGLQNVQSLNEVGNVFQDIMGQQNKQMLAGAGGVSTISLAGNENTQNVALSNNLIQEISGNGNVQSATGTGTFNSFELSGTGNMQDIIASGNVFQDITGSGNKQTITDAGGIAGGIEGGINAYGAGNIQEIVGSANVGQTVNGNGNMQGITGTAGLNSVDLSGMGNLQDIFLSGNIGQEIHGSGNKQFINGAGTSGAGAFQNLPAAGTGSLYQDVTGNGNVLQELMGTQTTYQDNLGTGVTLQDPGMVGTGSLNIFANDFTGNLVDPQATSQSAGFTDMIGGGNAGPKMGTILRIDATGPPAASVFV